VAYAGGFDFIQPGFKPPLNGIPIGIHLTTYRSGRFLLNEVKSSPEKRGAEEVNCSVKGYTN